MLPGGTVADWIGYAAALLVFCTFSMKGIVPLRQARAATPAPDAVERRTDGVRA